MAPTTGLRRDAASDAFYTIPSVASSCVQAFYAHIDPSPDDVLLEPSAGAGSFSSLLRARHLFAMDLEPSAPGILRQDFLRFEGSPLHAEVVSIGKPIHVIGNPPFGRQSSLARSFIRVCARFATSISFILPKSFKKPSFQSSFPPCFHLIYATDLPKNSFTVHGKPHDVPCVFQVWVRKSVPRFMEAPLEPVGFVFCGKGDNPDAAIRRVGARAGQLITQGLDGLSEQSHYFVRVVDGTPLGEWEARFRRARLSHDNTVGPRSVSKQEILCALAADK